MVTKEELDLNCIWPECGMCNYFDACVAYWEKTGKMPKPKDLGAKKDE